MEAKGCRQRWKLNRRELQSKRCSTTEDTERVKMEKEDKEEPYKGVTMAATSKYLTDRQYLTRKPLFSVEQHVSILKKTHPQRLVEKEKQQDVDRSGHHNIKFLTKPREELIPQRLSLSPTEISLPSTSKEDLSSPLGVSELLSQLHHEESTTFGTSFPVNRLAQQSLSSSNVEVHGLNLPLKPRLTSTVLYPTYTPCSNKQDQTQLMIESRKDRSWRERKLCSFGVNSKDIPKSPYQANYWACAIPKTLPPSPDRHSTAWDPDKEYQELLDYTYPLRPRWVESEWDSCKSLQDDIVLHTDLNLQDSGIAMGHPCSSASLPGLDISTRARGQSNERITLSPDQMSPDLQFITRSSDEPFSLLSLSSDCMDCSEDGGEISPFISDGLKYQHHMRSTSTFSAFIRSESVLRQSRCVYGEVDEEFRPLPDQVEELQLLSRQVREITANWDSLEPCMTSIPSSITLAEKQGPKVEDEKTKVKELQDDKQDKNDFKKWSTEHKSAPQTAAVHIGYAEGGLGRPSLKEAETLVDRLCGLSLIHNPKERLEDQEQSDSLMQHIKVFCSHLELLIQQLNVVSEKMELLTEPTVGMDRRKSSLADYQSFQREISSHRPLASCVLHTGQLLLSCINSTSPFLRDTLLLIESQSEMLQAHTEHFFSSILSAIDSLAQPSQASPVQQSTNEHPVAVQEST